MASRQVKLLSAGIIAMMVAGGWFLYQARAAQAQGALAQAPLNTQVQVAPSFIMAVDNSGSMRYQTQFPGANGAARWHNNSASFFTSPGVVRATGGQTTYTQIYTGDNGGALIPAVDAYGFARSPDFNPAYFNPEINYRPWMNADGTSYPDASLTATKINPRGSGGGNEINLASWLADENTRSRFQLARYMHIPEGTEYKVTGNNTSQNRCVEDGFSTGWGWRTAPAGGITASSGAGCQLYLKYWPATFYLRETVANTAPTISAPGYAGITPVRIPDACGNGCHLWRYRITSSDTVALQNFANWFSYYGNRNLAMIAGMTISFSTVENMRVGYFRINDHGSRDEPLTKAGERVKMHDMADADDRAALYSSMIALNASGSTPNRQAVNAIGQQFKRKDDDAPVKLVCQRNAGMLFTDGYSNQGTLTVGNLDSAMGTPFSDSHSDTMADIVTQYYLDDADGKSPLRPDLTAGKVPVSSSCPSSDPRVNCQKNLHMSFYGITLGARGDMFDPDAVQDPYTDSSIYTKWPASANDAPSTIDDIWHATVNTRGEFVSARTPADITEAMRRILSIVASGTSPSGTIAVSGSRIGDRSLAVSPSYEATNEGTDWFSELAAFKISENIATRTVTETQIWEASSRLGALSAATRSNQTWYGHASGVSRFNSTNITSLDTLCSGSLVSTASCNTAGITSLLGINVADAINYLMGDTSNEVRLGGKLRDRTRVLGDIINSSPVVSAPADDYGYSMLPAPYGSSYASYLTAKKTRPAMVYVGANDGMLHAFHGGINAEGDVDALNGGRQQFAYIPRAVLGHMGNLLFPYVAADGGFQKFSHRYFVDGPIAVGDAYDGSAWKTVLVGTTGAGGRSVFGLNVSDPTSFGASDRLWEIDDQHATASVRDNIGHVLGKPVIVPVKSSPGGAVNWKVVFGNGYNSASGKAVLFAVDIFTGEVQMTEAIEPGAPSTGKNGLGNIVVLDRWGGSDMTLNTRDGFADTVYAADQKGAIWKFDLRSMASTISVPVFTTDEHTESGVTYRQPILGGLVATAGRGNGVMLFFGTGSFSFVNDAADDSVQAIYGVLDVGSSTGLDSSDLFERTIGVSGATTRTISPATMGSGYSGWYLKLPAGERIVGYPRVASGVVFVPSYSPTIADGCSTQGANWLYGLSTRSGAPALETVRFGSTTGPTAGVGVGAVALDTKGTAPVKEVDLMMLSRRAPSNDPTAPGSAEDAKCWYYSGMAGGMYLPYDCGRQSWRQLQ